MAPDTRPQQTFLQTAPSRPLNDPVDEVPISEIPVVEDPAPPTSAPEESLTSHNLPITGKRYFRGMCVHVVQIGLGTNATFIQNVASPYDEDLDKGIEWILQSVSSRLFPSSLTGVAVEPAAEHAQALRPLVEKSLPSMKNQPKIY